MPINLSGSLVLTGSIVATGGITMSGSIASASYASYTSFLNNSGSGEFVPTGSFNTFSSSILTHTGSTITRLNSIETVTGSNLTRLGNIETVTGSNITRLNSLESKTGSYATTGSNTFIGTQTISGSVLQSGSFTTTGTIIAQTINVQTVTSSIVYSSGSNIFGNLLVDSQKFTGSVLITGSLTIAGGSSATSYNGATIFGSTIACSPIGCFATSCATSFIGGTMSGTCIIASSKIVVGGTSGDIGTDLLRVKGTIITDNNAGYLGYSSAGNRFELAKISSGDEIVLGAPNSPGAVALISGTGQDLILRSNGTCERIRISSAGNVGIGINNPGAKLQVKTTTSVGATDAFYIENTSLALFGVRDDGLIYMKGNVGIGTTTPSDILHIEKCQAGGMGMIIRNACAATSNTSMCSLISLQLVGTGQSGQIGVNLIAGKEGDYSSAGVRNAFFAIQTACGDNLYERLRITSNGNVGIGCNTPNRTLTVNGNIGMPTTYNWGVMNDNDTNWGFKVCTFCGNYSTFISYAGDLGSDRRGGIYNQNGHWVAYGNCAGHFVVQCNLYTNGTTCTSKMAYNGYNGVTAHDLVGNFVSDTTIATVTDFTAYTRVSAHIDWVTNYALAGTNMTMGYTITDTRRGNSNTMWVNCACTILAYGDVPVNPTFSWNNGVLTAYVPGSTGLSARFRIMTYVGTLTPNI